VTGHQAGATDKAQFTSHKNSGLQNLRRKLFKPKSKIQTSVSICLLVKHQHGIFDLVKGKKAVIVLPLLLQLRRL